MAAATKQPKKPRNASPSRKPDSSVTGGNATVAYVTPKQVATAIGVSEASLKRWCDKGLIESTRTAGGHRRLSIAGVVQYLRDSGHPLIKPEVLGLPARGGTNDNSLERAANRFHNALTEGNEEAARANIVNLYISGVPLKDICDNVIAAAFHNIGHHWENGKTEIYQERRACEFTTRIIHELRTMLPQPHLTAPSAIGGTFDCDPYSLPTALVELCMREAGWNAVSLGTGLPASTIITAMQNESRDNNLKILWLSISTYDNRQNLLERLAPIQQAAKELNITLVFGGRALASEVRADLDYAAYGENMRHLTGFLKSQ